MTSFRCSPRRRARERALFARFAVCLSVLGLGSCSGDPIEVSTTPGPSPFISLMQLQGTNFNDLARVEYTIAPKPGTVSKPVHVEYSLAALQARGYLQNDSSLTVPVFGLYSGYQNQVAVQLTWQHSTATAITVPISTATYTDPNGIYTSAEIVTARTPGSALGFDFIYIKSGWGSPVIIDTDAQIRWAAPGIGYSETSALLGDEFIIGDDANPVIRRMRLDGTLTQEPLPGGYTNFSHDITAGKTGLFAEVDKPGNLEATVAELSSASPSALLNHWDLAAILSNYMASNGDDPTQFVRPGIDWFHANSAIYDPSDDSLIVSSRENFVIKLDYQSGAIIWILGDPTKYWYTFPSLRAKALTLAPGGLYPIGQHALSFTSDGLLMLFNDGDGSLNQPSGASPGETRTYSAVSAYSIDTASMTAQESWNYVAGQTLYSPLCSSAYEAADKSLLVDYAMADNETTAILFGLNSSHQTVFEFQYPTQGCNTSWNARPIALDDLVIDQ